MTSVWTPKSRDAVSGPAIAWSIVALSAVVGVILAVVWDATTFPQFATAFAVGFAGAAICPITWFLGWLIERVYTGSRR